MLGAESTAGTGGEVLLRALLTQVGALALLTLLGLPLVRCCAPASWQPAAALAPALGLALFTVAASWLGPLGVPAPWTAAGLSILAAGWLAWAARAGGASALSHMVAPALARLPLGSVQRPGGAPAEACNTSSSQAPSCRAAVEHRRRAGGPLLPRRPALHTLALLVLPLAAGGLGLWPLLVAGYLAPLGVNADWEFYVPLGELLQHTGAWDPAGAARHPLLQAVNRPIARYSPWGFAYTHAAVSALVRQDALATFVPLLLLLLGVQVSAWWAAFRLLLGLRPGWAWCGAALVGLNAGLLFTAQWGWANQVQLLPLVPLALLAVDTALAPAPPAAAGGATMRSAPPSLVLAALVLAALPLAYGVGALPVAAAPLVPLALARLRPRRQQWWRPAILVAVAVGLSWPIIQKLLAVAPVLHQQGLSTGFAPQVLPPPSDWLGWTAVLPAQLAGSPPLSPALGSFLPLAHRWEVPAAVLSGAAGLGILAACLARWRAGEARPLVLLAGFAAGALALAAAGYYYGVFKYGTSLAGLTIGLFALALQELAGPRAVAAQAPAGGGRRRQVLAGALALAALVGAGAQAGALEARLAADGLRIFRAETMRFAALHRLVPPGAPVWLSDSPLLEGAGMSVATYFLRHADLYGRVRTGEGLLERALPPDALPAFALLTPLEDPHPHGFRPSDAVWRSRQAVLYQMPPDARALFLAARRPEVAVLQPKQPVHLQRDRTLAVLPRPGAPAEGPAPGLLLAGGKPASQAGAGRRRGGPPEEPTAAGLPGSREGAAHTDGAAPTTAPLPPVVAVYIAASTTGYVELVRPGDETLITRLQPGITRLEGGVARSLDVVWSPEGDAAAPAVLLAALLEPPAGGTPRVLTEHVLLATGSIGSSSAGPQASPEGVPAPALPALAADVRFASGLRTHLGAAFEVTAQLDAGVRRTGWWDVDVHTGVQHWTMRLEPQTGSLLEHSPQVGARGLGRFSALSPGRYTLSLVLFQERTGVARLELGSFTLTDAPDPVGSARLDVQPSLSVLVLSDYPGPAPP
jgi:hypothetical protein